MYSGSWNFPPLRQEGIGSITMRKDKKNYVDIKIHNCACNRQIEKKQQTLQAIAIQFMERRGET